MQKRGTNNLRERAHLREERGSLAQRVELDAEESAEERAIGDVVYEATKAPKGVDRDVRLVLRAQVAPERRRAHLRETTRGFPRRVNTRSPRDDETHTRGRHEPG